MKNPAIGRYFTSPVIDVREGRYPVVRMHGGQYCIINRGLQTGYDRENPPATGDVVTFVPLADNRVDGIGPTTLFARMIRLQRKQLATSV
ncbi:MAG: hypothetical protein HYT72_01530 [Candidatus Aenigmarchaeota archaeon]|nr:hypothetical protein [Candidatus Aenigmarchaeota archaeon]